MSERRGRLRIYGPVPSRRLGFSLGIDILPYKTCSFDCVYCQLGPSPKTRLLRRSFVPAEEAVSRVLRALRRAGRVDSLTFSGSGEPTLHRDLGRIIRGLKAATDVPVTVLTNGSLLSRPSVRRALLAADRVVPSLDAALPVSFARVNRPHPSLRLREIIRGLAEFRRVYRGQIWLEVMLVRGVNDSPADIRALKRILARLGPDKVQLNTVVRPPAEAFARPLTKRRLREICRELGPSCEVVANFKGRPVKRPSVKIYERILDLVRRRPVTQADLARSLGQERRVVDTAVSRLLGWGRLIKKVHGGREFLATAGGPAGPGARP